MLRTLILFLVPFALAAQSESGLQTIRDEFRAVSRELQNHVTDELWIDDAPEAPRLLTRQWALAAEWIAAWLNRHPAAGVEQIRAAFTELAPSSDMVCLALDPNSYLIAGPVSLPNAFIVSQSGTHYRPVWSTDQSQDAVGAAATTLAAWRSGNYRHGGRGPYSVSSGSRGSLAAPKLGSLPPDAKGRPRFYLDAVYAQGAGGTVGAQISITPEAVTALAQQVVVPELDVIDELLARVFDRKPAASLASPMAQRAARRIVARGLSSASVVRNEKVYPYYGMMQWSRVQEAGAPYFCVAMDEVGAFLFRFRPNASPPFLEEIKDTNQSCAP